MFNTHYLIKVPKGLAPDPAWHTTSEELGSDQPRLLLGRGRHHSTTKYSQWDTIRKRSFGLFLVTDCRGFAVSPRRFHTPIRSAPHSRESPFIRSSLPLEGHISQSCGADINSVHSFTSFSLLGDRHVYSVPHFQPGIDPFIGHPSRNGKMAVYRAPAFVHRFIGTLQPP